MEKKVLNINGTPRTIIANSEASLGDVLRGQLGLTGQRLVAAAQCGACTVILNGKLARSCVIKMKRVEAGSNVTTIEGIGTPLNLHPSRRHSSSTPSQCGFVPPASSSPPRHSLITIPSPTREDERDWFQSQRNACRCAGTSPWSMR